MTESAWLRQLVSAEIGRGVLGSQAPAASASSGTRTVFVRVRLHPQDRALLQARAQDREMALATYAAVLLRAHLRHLNPLPKPELIALRRSLTMLAVVAHALQALRGQPQRQATPESMRSSLQVLLEACVQLRANVKALLKANLRSWECGDV